MVLADIYETKFLLKKPYYAFLLGFAYAIMAIGFSILLFPQNPAMVAVGLTALFSFITIKKVMDNAFKKEEKEAYFKIKNVIKDNKEVYAIYIYLFFGIFTAFALFSLVLPQLASGHIFQSQLEIIGFSGKAYFNSALFNQILTNNIKVFGLCFIISLVIGNGALFIITWNASVWGTIFGMLAKTSSTLTQKNPVIYFILILFSVIPHTFLEASSYVIAGITGFLISKNIIEKDSKTEKFMKVLLYNLFLFLIGFIILLIGAFIETWVLSNGVTYNTIIKQAFN